VRLEDIDWRVLRGALVLLLFSVSVSAVLWWVSHRFWEDMERTYQREHNALVSVRSRYQTIDQEEERIRALMPAFSELQERGIIGREQRLDWVETLRRAVEELKLPSLRYAIDSQQPYEPDFPVPVGGSFRPYASTMTLDLGLLHEGDLPALLDVLERSARGLYSVADCRIRRTRPELGRDPRESNLQAQCRLRWLTVRLPEGEAT
jgi:hypothetical protein